METQGEFSGYPLHFTGILNLTTISWNIGLAKLGNIVAGTFLVIFLRVAKLTGNN